MYKYVVNDDVVYVGATTNLGARIATHARCVGIDAKFADYIKLADVYYVSLPNKQAMYALESLLISVYCPVLNEKGVPSANEIATPESMLPDFEWEVYSIHTTPAPDTVIEIKWKLLADSAANSITLDLVNHTISCSVVTRGVIRHYASLLKRFIDGECAVDYAIFLHLYYDCAYLKNISEADALRKYVTMMCNMEVRIITEDGGEICGHAVNSAVFIPKDSLNSYPCGDAYKYTLRDTGYTETLYRYVLQWLEDNPPPELSRAILECA